MRSLAHLVRRGDMTTRLYQLTDRLDAGRTVQVSADGIVFAVSAWLAELGASSPLVEDLAVTVRDGNWSAAHAIADCLSIDVAVAA
jgi:hypothetical protein